MSSVYLTIVVFLFVLAVFDLMVGVSNDAVNFLSPAVGAKVTKFRTIIIVAAVGVFIGATASNGMMEIARNGILHPSMFTIKEVMFIFLAAMISDVILLDIFNNLGLPTSTTVSMVFELLGATAAFSLLKIVGSDGALTLGDLMNTEKALGMILAIFVSVAIAFFFGTLLQYISRLVFTFTYKKNLKYKIGIFGGVCTTAIVYFMLFKGMSGMTFITPEVKDYINANTCSILGLVFLGSTLLMQLLYFLKVNVFKILVLMGTFSLAMAFAGNDLVNFIGVPLAGYSSYVDYMASGSADPDSFLMTSLNGPAHTPLIFLLAAGGIMVYALATSKKARNVIKTSVDLGRQTEGDEMFGSSRIARVLVRHSNNCGRTLEKLIPKKFQQWVETRFNNEEAVIRDGAAFDEIRATINLVVAGLLIALGTSLKLPLSTTYVTFMVAMGSSLADRAWGRESAVYRVTGVVSVIGGWFVTAGAAFILSFLIAMLLHLGGFIAACVLMVLAIYILIRSNRRFAKKKQEETGDILYNKMMISNDKNEVLDLLSQHIIKTQSDFLGYIDTTFTQVVDGFTRENLSLLRKAEDGMRRTREELKSGRRKEMAGLRRIDPAAAMEKNTWFHLGRNACEEILYCVRRIADPCLEHVDNNFIPLTESQKIQFKPLCEQVHKMIVETGEAIRSGSDERVDELRREGSALKSSLEKARDAQLLRMQIGKENISVGYLYVNILQEMRELTSSLRHLLRASKGFRQ
ncbi:MAG: inorganic phosphate transporter [Bacteroidia bacterium]|nr:inorganic phosphate transporter [Bacteroidia bacterium]